MNFGKAIEAMKAGQRVARAGWNGKGMWLCLIPSWEPWVMLGEAIEAFELERLPFIAMKTADDKLVPWLASQTDILVEDWEFVA